LSAPRRRLGSGWVGLILPIVAATTVMWLMSALAMVIYTNGAREPQTHTLNIPAGASELIAAGENPLRIPTTWAFLADDTLELVNEDSVGHWFGQYFVAAGYTRQYELQPQFGASLLCSLHPDGEITIDVEVRDFDWRSTLIPALALGPALGLIFVGVRRVLRALDEPDLRRN